MEHFINKIRQLHFTKNGTIIKTKKTTSYLVFKNTIILSFIVFSSCSIANAQQLSQTIRGVVIDSESKTTLPGANVIVLGAEPMIGATTDNQGAFKLENVPVGRQTIIASFVGYDRATISEIPVGSAKEVVLTIRLIESFTKIEEITVKSTKGKGKPKNEMISVSGRSFTVEETKRYPASISDPSRMALSFAGVGGGEDASNEIIIRGNSPNGLLWRLEGVEIPSPNHFSEEGYSAGYVSILSSNMTGVSDFITGAFPAEYGNASSGVFDISLRKGNNQKREYGFELGFIGIGISIEGPFKKGAKSSYLVNYRYSSLALLGNLGVAGLKGVAPDYQDLSYKFHFYTNKAGQFSLWGIGGIGSAYEEAEKDSTQWEYFGDRINDLTETSMWATGLTHLFFPGNNSYFKTTLSFSGTTSLDDNETLEENYIPEKLHQNEYRKTSYRANILYNHKISKRLTLRTGAVFSKLNFDLWEEGKDSDNDNKWTLYTDQKGDAGIIQTYFQTKYRLTEKLTFNTGVHYLYMGLNKAQSIEPRASVSYQINHNQTLGLGFGIHSRHDELSVYYMNVITDNEQIVRPNMELDLSKAAHYVLSYENMLTDNLRLKVETYLQNLWNVPVAKDKSSTFSTINGQRNEDFSDTLVNNGKARNYGVEFTLEKSFTDNYYFLFTSSLFNSRYMANNGEWYHTRFDIRYINNFVAGKEFYTGKNHNNIFGMNAKLIWSGGKRDNPIDLEKSLADGHSVYYQDKRYEIRYDDYFRLDVGVNYRINKKKVSHLISLDIQNMTNRKNIFMTYFDRDALKTVKVYQTGLIPILSYKLEF